MTEPSETHPGLTSAEVVRLTEAGHANEQPRDSSRSIINIVRVNALTPFNAVVAVSLVALLLLGAWQDALFAFAAFANVVIGVTQEYSAKRSLDRIAVLGASEVTVLREGVSKNIKVATVVLGDTLVLRPGDQVAADAVIIRSSGLELNESMLTGESQPVIKSADDEVLSGSGVVSGTGIARVIRVGPHSFANRLTAEARQFSLVSSELRKSVALVVTWISWLLLPVILLVLNAEMQARGGWTDAISSGAWKAGAIGTIASATSLIPQGLILLTSIAFALAAVKLAREGVLVQELAAVEVLARVDVVCLDKTGTLTEGTIVFDEALDLGGVDSNAWKAVLGWFGADPGGTPTTRCLTPAFPHASRSEPIDVVPFDSLRKWSSVSFDSGSAAGAWVFGAPDFVLEDRTEHSAALATAARLAAGGQRVLVLAWSPGAGPHAEAPHLPADLVPAVILTFREKIRGEAAPTIAYFRSEAVQMRVLSGDHPATVASVAREVGIEFVGNGFDARQLPTEIEELADILEREWVFGRVSPTQKRSIVRALQHRGHVVAMTGDGINDALALKQADLGIAMGAGASITRSVSRIVLLDDKFSRLPGVVAEGRRVTANVERVSRLFLTKTIYALLLSIAAGVLLWIYPFLPRQLAPVDGLTIGLPAFALALAPNLSRYQPGFLRRTLAYAVPAGATIAGVLIAVGIGGRTMEGVSVAQLQMASWVGLSVTAIWVLGSACRPFSAWRFILLVSMVTSLALCGLLQPIRQFLGFDFPPVPLLMTALVAATLGCVLMAISQKFVARTGSGGRIRDKLPRHSPGDNH